MCILVNKTFSFSGLEITNQLPGVGWNGHIRIPITNSPVSNWKIFLEMDQSLDRLETWQPTLNSISSNLYLMTAQYDGDKILNNRQFDFNLNGYGTGTNM